MSLCASFTMRQKTLAPISATLSSPRLSSVHPRIEDAPLSLYQNLHGPPSNALRTTASTLRCPASPPTTRTHTPECPMHHGRGPVPGAESPVSRPVPPAHPAAASPLTMVQLCKRHRYSRLSTARGRISPGPLLYPGNKPSVKPHVPALSLHIVPSDLVVTSSARHAQLVLSTRAGCPQFT